MDNIESLIEQFSNLLQSFYGAPSYMLVVFSCVVIGYVLKQIPKFPNGGIPLCVILWGGVFFPIIADDNSQLTLRVWMVRNILYGLVLGFIAWLLHNQVLSRIEDKFGLFSSNTNSKPQQPTNTQ